MLETVAKAVLIVVSPFLVLRKDCATSLAPRQLLKGDGLHKYGRLCDLFGVAAEVLSGAVRWRWSDELNCRRVESQFASIRSAARPQTNSQACRSFATPVLCLARSSATRFSRLALA